LLFFISLIFLGSHLLKTLSITKKKPTFSWFLSHISGDRKYRI